MSVQHANRGVVKKDLQLYYNREFSKSFRGEATTNLYGTYGVGAANAYPSAGNNWGTLYARFYNGGAFFSIGTIASVSVDNVITVSSPTSIFNGLATYDVIQPQTTGGGVTAGINYYFKRLTSTTFTLHQWDSTNDASKTPEQILFYINSDTRISVNGTSFPTMWWGYPHIPNSALIKTAITNGFAYDNRLHDCVRFHFFRSDTRGDGMAYDIYPAYVANQQYTFSMYVRATSQGAIGGRMSLSFYFSGTGTGAGGYYSPILTTNWQRWTATFTASATSGVLYTYIFNDTGTLPLTVDIAELQLEQKAYASEFTPTSRSANTVAGGGGLLDISGNNVNADLTNVAFDSGGYYFTTAGNNYLNTGITTLPSNTQLTIDVWTKPTSTTQTKTLVSKWGSGSQSNYCFLLFLNWFAQGNLYFLVGNSAGTNYSTHGITHGLSTSSYINYTVTYDNGVIKMYKNGVLALSETSANTVLKSVTTAITIGADYDGGNPDTLTRHYDGIIPNVKLYSKPLSDVEVLQNFNATRKTYGI
jgi:hypothetical protein